MTLVHTITIDYRLLGLESNYKKIHSVTALDFESVVIFVLCEVVVTSEAKIKSEDESDQKLGAYALLVRKVDNGPTLSKGLDY
jgi:hypothetical protein